MSNSTSQCTQRFHATGERKVFLNGALVQHGLVQHLLVEQDVTQRRVDLVANDSSRTSPSAPVNVARLADSRMIPFTRIGWIRS